MREFTPSINTKELGCALEVPKFGVKVRCDCVLLAWVPSVI